MFKMFMRMLEVFIPMMLVVGLVNYALRGFQGDFMPSYSSWVSWMQSFPDVVGEYRQIYEYSTAPAVCDATDSFGLVYCMFTNSEFNKAVNIVVRTIWMLITVPFRVLGWFFGFLFITN